MVLLLITAMTVDPVTASGFAQDGRPHTAAKNGFSIRLEQEALLLPERWFDHIIVPTRVLFRHTALSFAGESNILGIGSAEDWMGESPTPLAPPKLLTTQKPWPLRTFVFGAMESKYAKKGGLGDYIKDWPAHLARYGHQVYVVTPSYANKKVEGKKTGQVKIRMGKAVLKMDVKLALDPKSPATLVPDLIEDPKGVLFREPYQESRGLRGLVESIVLSRAIDILARVRKADVVQTNDWQTALTHAYMSFNDGPAFRRTVHFPTIHNMGRGYQGVFPRYLWVAKGDPVRKMLREAGVIVESPSEISQDRFIDTYPLFNLKEEVLTSTDHGLEYHSMDEHGRPVRPGQFALAKAMRFANTSPIAPSREYARRLTLPEDQGGRAGGMEGVFNRMAREGKPVEGFLNGVDADPSQDDNLNSPEARALGYTGFSPDDPDLIRKLQQNKHALLRELGMSDAEIKAADNDLLLGIVGRITGQKGVDYLIDAFPRLAAVRGPRGQKIRLVALGYAEQDDDWGQAIVQNLKKLQDKFPDQVIIETGFKPPLASRIYAASDVFPMPSRYEPGGIADQIANKYGTRVIAPDTDGFRDFFKRGGIGSDYPESSPVEGLCQTIQAEAQMYWNHRDEWNKSLIQAVHYDASWDSRMEEYEEFYERSIHHVRGEPNSGSVTPTAAGALGIWKNLFGWTNLTWVGFVEGTLITSLSTLAIWGLMPQGPPHAIYQWFQAATHVPGFVLPSLLISSLLYLYLSLQTAHYYLGVLQPNGQVVYRGWALSKQAAKIASSSFAGLPFIVAGLLSSGWVAASLILSGILVGAALHAFLNSNVRLTKPNITSLKLPLLVTFLTVAASLVGGVVGMVLLNEPPHHRRGDRPDQPHLTIPKPGTRLNQRPFEQLWEGVGENNVDWQRRNIIMGQILAAAKETPSVLIDEKMIHAIQQECADFDAPSNEKKVHDLLGKLMSAGVLRDDGGAHFSLIVAPEVAAIKFDRVDYILADLLSPLHDLRASDTALRQIAMTRLRDLFIRYSEAADQWSLYPVEARWPLLEAITLLSKSEQEALLEFLQSEDEQNGLRNWALVDAVMLMLEANPPKNWLLRFASALKGLWIYMIAAEGWYAGGGLGSVEQTHAAGMQELADVHAEIHTVEPQYAARPMNNPEGGEEDPARVVPIDYRHLPTPVENLTFDRSYLLRLHGRKTIVSEHQGRNQHGVRVHLIEDTQSNGHDSPRIPYYFKLLYRHKPKWNVANQIEFIEFFCRVSLSLVINSLEKLSRQFRRSVEAVVFVHDGQASLFPHLKRLWDRHEKLLRHVAVGMFTHTVFNRLGIWNTDATSIGIGAADGAFAVSANHRYEVAARKDPAARVVAITNADNRKATRQFFQTIWKDLAESSAPFLDWVQQGFDEEHPLAPQIRLIKPEARRRFNSSPHRLSDRELIALGLDPTQEILNPNQMTLGYDGRLVPEKIDLQRAFSYANLKFLIEHGVQVVLYTNVQEHTTDMFRQLREWAVELNKPLKENPARGRLIVRTGWGPEEKFEMLTFLDVLVLDSQRTNAFGTEAAGKSETNGAAVGCIVVTTSGLQGILQGLLINRNKPGWGYTLVPKEVSTTDKEQGALAYREDVYKWLIALYRDKPDDFAAYQATAIKLSRVLEARLAAAEYLHQANLMVLRKKSPLVALHEFMAGVMEMEKLYRLLPVRIDLSNALARSKDAQRLNSTPADYALAFDVRAFELNRDNRHFLVSVDENQNPNPAFEEKRFHVLSWNPIEPKDPVNVFFEHSLGQLAARDPRTKFRTWDVGRRQWFAVHSMAEVMEDGFQFGVPVGGVQVLELVPWDEVNDVPLNQVIEDGLSHNPVPTELERAA